MFIYVILGGVRVCVCDGMCMCMYVHVFFSILLPAFFYERLSSERKYLKQIDKHLKKYNKIIIFGKKSQYITTYLDTFPCHAIEHNEKPPSLEK